MIAPDSAELGDTDFHLFNQGTHARLYDKLGCHIDGAGARFAVWAPNAERVAVIGDWNGWGQTEQLLERHPSGIWHGAIAAVPRGAAYKYRIEAKGGYRVDKADPMALRQELPPRTGSVVWSIEYEWGDGAWMADRERRNRLSAPISIYEMHLGSFMRVPEDHHRSLSYRELAPRLIAHLKATGFTHVEFMPVMEHPFYGSWGYQVTGYFAPTARYGTPQDLMYLIDHLHQAGIGVILDWVPAHFPKDEHGLSFFDGTHLYEHADPRQGFHPEWKSAIFNYGRNEVRSFLTSSASFWLDRYHADALRVDGVASMLYLDYGREAGQWIPNRFGGRENLEAVQFLQQLNASLYRDFPDTQTIAEESTAWPMVSRPLYLGGLGFGLKWDLGWMHDTLTYLGRDPVHRHFHQQELTFRRMYAFTENFVMPLSHDEVVYGKGSLLGKMNGDEWQKRANLRLLYALLYAQPGKKLLFMGAEFAATREWNHDDSLDWDLAKTPAHSQIQLLVGELNRLYRDLAPLHELDHDARGFEWVEANDAEYSVLSFLRRSANGNPILCVFNFTPIPRFNYRVGVPAKGSGDFWTELLNSDAQAFGGSGHGNQGGVEATPVPAHGRRSSLNLILPPLGALYLAPR